jgi:Omp85 superfamily domain
MDAIRLPDTRTRFRDSGQGFRRLSGAGLLLACVAHGQIMPASGLPEGAPGTDLPSAVAGTADRNPLMGMFISEEDNWPDLSGFLEQDWGFLPMVMPISEPAVGYGVAAGPVFVDAPEGGGRPNITAVAGFATENGTWGAVAADSRYWLDGRLQTLVGGIYSTVNLDFFGIGKNRELEGDPLHYELEPKGGTLQAKYRIGDSSWWAGLSYAFFSTGIGFDAPSGTLNLPDFQRDSVVGGISPSLTLDTRDNIFTPTKGSFFDLTTGLFGEALGGDDNFQRVQVVGMHFVPLVPEVFLGLRGQAAAAFGDAPFYLEPFLQMRGVQAMRYQGEEIAQLEAEIRWQFWERISVVGFAGCGAAWNDWGRFEKNQTVTMGGFGLRYELARKYGIHGGVDVAFGPDDPTIYIQIGSAWARP